MPKRDTFWFSNMFVLLQDMSKCLQGMQKHALKTNFVRKNANSLIAIKYVGS